MATRSYLIGLPVLVTVDDEGNVEYDVDTSEAAEAIYEYEDEDYDESFFILDGNNVATDHTLRTPLS